MKQAKIMAFCGMMAALSIVIMVLGAALEIGIYAAPMLAGLCLLPVGRKFGRKYQLLLWLAVSVLALILVPNPEESLMYACLFGCYPVIRTALQKLPPFFRIVAKLLYFNGVTVSLELLLWKLLLPQPVGWDFAAVLLVLGNATFFLYDFILPKAEYKMERIFP